MSNQREIPEDIRRVDIKWTYPDWLPIDTRPSVALPLTTAADEIELLRRSVPERKIILAIPSSAKEYTA